MAVNMDGSNDFIQCSTLSLAGSTEMTMCAWINFSSYAAGILALWGQYSSGNAAFLLETGRSGAIGTSAGLISYDPGAGALVYTAAVLSTGIWQHIAIVFDGGLGGGSAAHTPYVNGSSVAVVLNGTFSTAIGSVPQAVTLGACNNASRAIDATFEDFRVFKRALSAGEIQTLAAGYRGPMGGEVCWFPLMDQDGVALTSAAGSVVDISGMGNHGKPQNGGGVYEASYAPRSQGWIP